LIERATPAYFARLFIRVEEGGLWYLHRRGIDPPGVFEGAALSVALDVAPLLPRVEWGRWLVDCPFCPGAQLAGPTSAVFFCCDCANAEVGGSFVRVGWPPDEDLAAIEAALLARPNPQHRNWSFNETIGALLAENVAVLALFDPTTGVVHGDILFDQQKVLQPLDAEPALSRGARA
jgi:hypothetical protein